MRRPFADKRPLGPFMNRKQTVSQNTSLDNRDLGNVDVHFHTSENMEELANESVSLIVTSPPYNFNWDYNSYNDESNYVSEYLSLLARVFNESYKKLMPEGRLAVNLPTIDKQSSKGRSGNISTASDVISMMVTSQTKFGAHAVTSGDIRKMRSNTDWLLEDHIIWNKGIQSASTGLASLGGGRGRPFRFSLDSTHESIIVFQKPGKRNLDNVPTEYIKASSLDKSFWTRTGDPPEGCSTYPQCHTTAKDNLWTAQTTNIFNENGEKVPAFPEVIPERLIKSYSFVGDTVVDPFAGAGTTLKVASNLDRSSVGYELREELKPLIKRNTGQDI